uniref:Uncharacterized protein n=1 Tax=Arundo donax TaxID=35708 RepID=A0A0A8YYQ7_ARUDO
MFLNLVRYVLNSRIPVPLLGDYANLRFNFMD